MNNPLQIQHILLRIGSFTGVEYGLPQVSKRLHSFANCEEIPFSDALCNKKLKSLARITLRNVPRGGLLVDKDFDRLENPAVQQKVSGICLSASLRQSYFYYGVGSEPIDSVHEAKVTQLFVHVFAKMTVLTKLDISGNHLEGSDGDHLAQGLSAVHTLTDLNISDNAFGIRTDDPRDPFRPTALLHCIGTMVRLQRLNISACTLDSKACKFLFTKLRGNTTLCDLNLSENNLGQVYYGYRSPDLFKMHNFRTICQILPTLAALKTLDLSETMIGKPVLPTGWRREDEGAYYHSDTDSYKIDTLPIRRLGVSFLAEAVRKMPSLETLVVRNNDMFAKNVYAEKKNEHKFRLKQWARAIYHQRTLKKLDITGNGHDVSKITVRTAMHPGSGNWVWQGTLQDVCNECSGTFPASTSSESQPPVCLICLEPMPLGGIASAPPVRVSNIPVGLVCDCTVHAHSACLERWLQRRLECPICHCASQIRCERPHKVELICVETSKIYCSCIEKMVWGGSCC